MKTKKFLIGSIILSGWWMNQKLSNDEIKFDKNANKEDWLDTPEDSNIGLFKEYVYRSILFSHVVYQTLLI